MEKSDREDAQYPITAGAVPDSQQRDIDDDVTAEVVPGSEHVDQIEPVIISNLNDHEFADGLDYDQDDDELEPGVILRDRFEIIELVHSGGMGRVYKALDNRRHRSASDQIYVAIKMMRRQLNPDFDSRLALEREAARTQQLSHPNIVNIYDFDQHDEQFFIVMEWLEGESLNAMLRRMSGRPIAPEAAWRIVEGIASGLQHAHAHDVIHADINPSNVFITDRGDIKLLDFGVARLANRKEEESDRDVVWATHSYASPEVLSGSAPEFEDDIFSLGCVAYRALAGRHPFGGKSSTTAKREKFPLEPIPGLADRYWQILRHSLALDKADRPSSADVFFVANPAPEEQPVAPGLAKAYWLPALIAAAVVLLSGYWWFQQYQADEGRYDAAEPTAAADAVSIDSEPISEPSALDVLLASASEAMDGMRFVEPETDNARAIFREVLAIDPANEPALAGLREIGAEFVRRSEIALRANDPEGAAEALGVAIETDPDNPEIDMVRDLLLAQANNALANAQVAAIEGEFERAGELLAQAERYTLIDSGEIDQVRNRIDRARQERELLDAVAAADASIAAGNLVAPEPGNAHERLLELQRVYGNEPRIVASIETLIERLLNRAAFATAAEQFTVAAELLDAAAVFGELEADVAVARTWLQQAMELSSIPDTGGTDMVEMELDPTEDTSAVMSTGETDAEASAFEDDILELVPADSDPSSADTASPLAEEAVPISELGIENFVSPRYPRGASERGLTGSVDLRFDVNPDGTTSNIEAVDSEPQDTFVPSAINAVRRWRFAERDDVITAQVRLRFDLQEPQ